MHRQNRDTDRGMTELALVKGRHRWLFRYAPGDELHALHSVARAAGSGHGLDWADAAMLARQLGYRIPTTHEATT